MLMNVIEEMMDKNLQFLLGVVLLFAGIAVWFHDVEYSAVFITFTALAGVMLIVLFVYLAVYMYSRNTALKKQRKSKDED